MSKTFEIKSPEKNLEELLKKSEITTELPVENFEDRAKDDFKEKLEIEIPNKTGISPSKALKSMSEDRRGLTVKEGLKLVIENPEVLDIKSIDLLGSRYKRDCTPTIYKWKGEIKLSAICSDVSDPMCGPAYVLKM